MVEGGKEPLLTESKEAAKKTMAQIEASRMWKGQTELLLHARDSDNTHPGMELLRRNF